MKYDLLVVGNGFDKGCNYKTSYSEFLDSFRGRGVSNYLISFFQSAYNNSLIENEEWNGFENLLCQYLQFLDYLFNSTTNVKRHFSDEEEDAWGNHFRRYYYLTIEEISKLPQNIYVILTLVSPLDDKLFVSTSEKFNNRFTRIDDYSSIRELYFRVFINATLPNMNKQYVLSYLLKELDMRLKNLETELKTYIASVTTEPSSLPYKIIDDTTDRIMSFNYSRTAQRMFGLDDDRVAYVHGDIGSDVVIGVEPSMIDGQTFKEQSSFIMFFKRFRRIYKNCNKSFNHKIINKLNENSIIGIYGHSLDLADRSLLYPLFVKKYKAYFVYCYQDVNPYKLKLVNLLGLDLYDELEKDDKIKLIKVS